MKKEDKTKTSLKSYIDFIVAVILKPVTAFKKELNKFDDIKIAGIYTAIVAAVIMLINLINQIIISVRIPVRTGGNWMTPGTVTGHEWDWSGMNELPWVELILRNYLIYIAVIAGVALVYFLAGLIAKKEVKYQRVLAVVTTSAIPVIVLGMVLAPLFGWIHFSLGFIVASAALIYVFALLFSGINAALSLEDADVRVYLHAGCMLLLAIISYFVIQQMATSIFADLF